MSDATSRETAIGLLSERRARWVFPLMLVAMVLAGGLAAFGIRASIPRHVEYRVVLVRSRDLNDSVPSLTLTQTAAARRVATSSHLVQVLARGYSYHIAGVAPWTRPDGTIIGAVVPITLTRPHTLAGVWLAVSYACASPQETSYATVPYQAKRGNVSALLILVDLGRGTVVGINPDRGARLIGRVKGGKQRQKSECSIATQSQ